MGKLHQLYTTVSCSFASLLTGLLYVWPSYTLGLFRDPKTTLLSSPMTEIESSLLGSLPPLGAMFGTAVAGLIISKLGRQKGGMLLVLPIAMSWMMIDMTSSSTLILIARFISGLGCGANMVYAPMFISEVAEESIRGALASVPIASYCIGLQVSYIMGWFLSYRYIVWANLAFGILGVALLLGVTESPVFLLRQNREEEARLAIAHYRGASPASKIVLEELSRLKQQLTPAVELIAINTDENTKAEEAEKEKLNADNDTQETNKKMSSLKMLYTSPSARRGFIVVGTALTLQVLMGMVAVQVYAKQIFMQSAPSLSSHFCSVIFALMILLGSLTSAAVTDKFGRKFLLITSSISVALCLFAMGIFLQTEIVPPWVTAILILVYCFFFILGAGSIPYVLLAEYFLPEVQSLASTLLMEWVWLLNFLIIGVFPFMIKYFDIYGSFYIFACFGVVSSLVGIFFVPETKGLTKEEIQESLIRRRKK